METVKGDSEQGGGCSSGVISPHGENLISSALLDGLAREYGTDKGSQYHGYAEQYGRILDPLRRGPQAKTVIEIGVCRKWEGNRHICPSLAMWRDWFAAAGGASAGGREINVRVVGLDKCDFGLNGEGGILTLVCDQGSAGQLAAARVAAEKAFGTAAAGGGVDLIVDDGSHEARHQQMTMKALWPCLRVGGAYVIEDLNYNPEHERPIRRMRGCVETWQAGMKPLWLVDLRREMKTVDKIEWWTAKLLGSGAGWFCGRRGRDAPKRGCSHSKRLFLLRRASGAWLNLASRRASGSPTGSRTGTRLWRSGRYGVRRSCTSGRR